jgi:hypothetical protein
MAKPARDASTPIASSIILPVAIQRTRANPPPDIVITPEKPQSVYRSPLFMEALHAVRF